MRIVVDVDAVVANLDKEWFRRYNRDYNDNIKHEDIIEWDTAKIVKPECGNKIYDYLYDADLYDNVEPEEDSQWGVSQLKQLGHQVVFVTSCVESQFYTKYEWLKRFGFLSSLKEYIVASDKSFITGDIMIDDYHKNLETFNGIRILFSGPWNTKYTGFQRATGWKEVLELIKILGVTND